MDFEAKLLDSNESLLAVYSPSHIHGETPLIHEGKFILEGQISLPKNITHGNYWLSIALAQPNVEYYATFLQDIKLEVEGVTAGNGRAFEYKDCGFLMLD